MGIMQTPAVPHTRLGYLCSLCFCWAVARIPRGTLSSVLVGVLRTRHMQTPPASIGTRYPDRQRLLNTCAIRANKKTIPQAVLYGDPRFDVSLCTSTCIVTRSTAVSSLEPRM